MESDFSVILYPELIVDGLRHNLVIEVLAYHVMRRMDSLGTGLVDRRQAQAILRRLVNTDQCAYRALHGGDGRYWRLSKDKVALLSFEKVCYAAAHSIPAMRPISILLDDITPSKINRTRLTDWSTLLVASCLLARDRVMSRFANLVGCHETTARRRLQHALADSLGYSAYGIHRHRVLGKTKTLREASAIATKFRDKAFVKVKYNNGWEITRDLSNAYFLNGLKRLHYSDRPPALRRIAPNPKVQKTKKESYV